MSQEDEKYMRRCLQLAGGGRGNVAPNPMVGSVIVAKGKIIAEGFHRRCGGPHAEVHAIRSIKDLSMIPESTLYVNLEPCSHYGKTPPCAELIIKTGIPRVVVGCLDPFPPVSGRGVKMLREAGIEVVTGCLEMECREINRVFMTVHSRNRPYVFLKWAQSCDGFLDRKRTTPAELPVVFSTPVTGQNVHKRRSETESILVGTNTAILDDPSLTVRTWSGESPVRLVIDQNLIIPSDAKLLDEKVKTLIFTNHERKNGNNIEYVLTNFNGKEISFILDYLLQHNISSLMVEGGSNLLNQFLSAGLWDEIQIERSSRMLYEGIKAPDLSVLSNEKDFEIKRKDNFVAYYRRLNSF